MVLTIKNKTSGRYGNLMRVTLVDFIYAETMQMQIYLLQLWDVQTLQLHSVAYNAILKNKQTWLATLIFLMALIPPMSSRTDRPDIYINRMLGRFDDKMSPSCFRDPRQSGMETRTDQQIMKLF